MENKSLSQRKSYVSEKVEQEKKTGVNLQQTRENNMLNRFYENYRKKTKVSDLIYCDDNRNSHLAGTVSIKDTMNLTQTTITSNQAPLPKNFKRIPAMIDSLTK